MSHATNANKAVYFLQFSINSTDTYLCCLQPLKSKNTKKDFYFIFHEVERMKNN